MVRMVRVMSAIALFCATFAFLGTVPAQAAGRVSVVNEFGSAKIDGTYSTTLTVSGSGFQSIKGGHGGVYVWFGTVSAGWQPSKGGVSGQDYRYVPDSEEANNQGFQRYVAFPGSDTASSAAATMDANGSWRVKLAVPGPTFQAVGRNGAAVTVDCRKVQCGVITVGAHGVKNANNETFSPVSVDDLYKAQPAATDPDELAGAVPPEPGTPAEKAKRKAGNPKLEVDRTSAVAGRVLPFTVTGLVSGQQITVVFADGRAAAGPFLVGETGQLAGVITLPAELPAGTYELRVFGVDKAPSVKFAVRAADDATDARPAAAHTDEKDDTVETWGKIFTGFAAALLLLALARLLLIARSRRAK
ncbi:hypothetical protein ACLM5J_07540 [Nocardioides sp. Bht2]|uniref:hypothetical protein n=1 Tax=Nocardioides sp. Bht2 TaxID=3392297 RepID=UPI0039B56C2C